jgi:ribosome biogenesis GTPase
MDCPEKEIMTTALQGMVLRAQSGLYVVLDETGTAECRARRRLQRPSPDWPEFPVPGDEVEWGLLTGSSARREGIIEAVRPRRSEISRSRFGAKHVVIANLEQLVVVLAVRDPALNRGLLDRLLAVAERIAIRAVICFNKIDLATPGELDAVGLVYQRAGYHVVCTSAATGEGLEALRAELRGHTSAFMGPSGAGKSRLISALEPGLELRTGDVSDKSRQGRHTTTRVDLHRTQFGALLADTPGVRDFNAWQLTPLELRELFPEFRPLQPSCHYPTCGHTHEPGCAVQQALQAGGIDSSRYRSYLAILEELNAAHAGVDREGRRRKGRSDS